MYPICVNVGVWGTRCGFQIRLKLNYLVGFGALRDSAGAFRRPDSFGSGRLLVVHHTFKQRRKQGNAPIPIQVRMHFVRLWLFVRLCACSLVCLFVQWQKVIEIAFSLVLQSGHLFVCLFARLLVRLFVCLLVCLSVCLAVDLCVCVFGSLFLFVFVRLFVSLFVCLCGPRQT